MQSPYRMITAVANQKGGVREDDHCCESGGALARGSKRHGVPPAKVLLVDLDPQGNCATSFGVEKRRIKHTTYDLLVHEGGEPLPLMKEYFLGPKELTESMRLLPIESHMAQSGSPQI